MATLAEKRRARGMVTRAVKSGAIARPSTCEACGAKPPPSPRGRPAIVLHHPDYGRPLDVIPLCDRCHRLVHFGRLVEPRTGRMYPDGGPEHGRKIRETNQRKRETRRAFLARPRAEREAALDEALGLCALISRRHGRSDVEHADMLGDAAEAA